MFPSLASVYTGPQPAVSYSPKYQLWSHWENLPKAGWIRPLSASKTGQNGYGRRSAVPLKYAAESCALAALHTLLSSIRAITIVTNHVNNTIRRICKSGVLLKTGRITFSPYTYRRFKYASI